MDKNDELFKGIAFADLMSDVYHNSKKKDRMMNQLIASLQPLIKNASDATVVMPLIKDILDVSIKNDDHLVKLTAIVQRYISTKQTITGDGGLLSEEEKMQLLKVAEDTLHTELQTWESDADDMQPLVHRVETLKQSIVKDSDG
jgi:hypothetical protein